MSDLTDYIGARQSRLYGETTTTSAGPPSARQRAGEYLELSIDPELSDAGRAEALEIALLAAELYRADVDKAIAEGAAADREHIARTIQ